MHHGAVLGDVNKERPSCYTQISSAIYEMADTREIINVFLGVHKLFIMDIQSTVHKHYFHLSCSSFFMAV